MVDGRQKSEEEETTRRDSPDDEISTLHRSSRNDSFVNVIRRIRSRRSRDGLQTQELGEAFVRVGEGVGSFELEAKLFPCFSSCEREIKSVRKRALGNRKKVVITHE